MKRAIVFTLVPVGVSIFVGALASKALWGYFFFRPSVDPRLLEATRLVSVGSLDSAQAADGTWAFVPAEQEGPADAIAYCRLDAYYCTDRALLALEEAGFAFPAAPSLPDDLSGLYRVAAGGPWTVVPDPGYESPVLRGTAVVAESSTYGRLVHLEIGRPEIANDSYVRYSLLLFREADGWVVLSSSRFFYDIAGIEFAEWYVLAPFFYILLLLAAVVLVSGYDPLVRAMAMVAGGRR